MKQWCEAEMRTRVKHSDSSWTHGAFLETLNSTQTLNEGSDPKTLIGLDSKRKTLDSTPTLNERPPKNS